VGWRALCGMWCRLFVLRPPRLPSLLFSPALVFYCLPLSSFVLLYFPVINTTLIWNQGRVYDWKIQQGEGGQQKTTVDKKRVILGDEVHHHCFRHGESHSKWGRGQRRCLGLSLSYLAFVVSVLLGLRWRIHSTFHSHETKVRIVRHRDRDDATVRCRPIFGDSAGIQQ